MASISGQLPIIPEIPPEMQSTERSQYDILVDIINQEVKLPPMKIDIHNMSINRPNASFGKQVNHHHHQQQLQQDSILYGSYNTKISSVLNYAQKDTVSPVRLSVPFFDNPTRLPSIPTPPILTGHLGSAPLDLSSPLPLKGMKSIFTNRYTESTWLSKEHSKDTIQLKTKASNVSTSSSGTITGCINDTVENILIKNHCFTNLQDPIIKTQLSLLPSSSAASNSSSLLDSGSSLNSKSKIKFGVEDISLLPNTRPNSEDINANNSFITPEWLEFKAKKPKKSPQKRNVGGIEKQVKARREKISKPLKKRKESPQPCKQEEDSDDEADGSSRRKRSKAPRSKNGCWTCRLRRKRCPEQRPVCFECVRLGLECDGYSEDRPKFMRGSMESKNRMEEIKRITLAKKKRGTKMKYEALQDKVASIDAGMSTTTTSTVNLVEVVTDEDADPEAKIKAKVTM